MEDGTIRNNQISSSTDHNQDLLRPEFWSREGRLNNPIGYFATSSDQETPPNIWFQVDLKSDFTITGIKVQGGKLGPPFNFNEYLLTLQVNYGDSVDSLAPINDGNGQAKVCLYTCSYCL